MRRRSECNGHGTKAAGEPRLHPGMFVGAVVVDDEMDIQGFGHIGVDMPQDGRVEMNFGLRAAGALPVMRESAELKN